MTDSISIETIDALLEKDHAAIQSGLQAYNMAAGGIDEVVPFSIVARDENNELVGGLLARTWGTCCEVMILWVRENRRRQGIGRRLMAEIETGAKSRGCTLVYLDTFSFQAPDFYTSLGYKVDHTVTGFPRGIQKLHMSKQFT